MTIKLALSQIKALPFDFEKAVVDFIKAKKDHQATEGKPAPSAPHAWVETAVRRVPGSIEESRADDFVADFEIVDDTPPAPTLDQRKQVLAHQASMAFQGALARITPPLKARMLSIEAGRASAVEVDKRTPTHLATLKAAADRSARNEAITFHLATLESEIHDLTEDTIDAWKPAPFPGA